MQKPWYQDPLVWIVIVLSGGVGLYALTMLTRALMGPQLVAKMGPQEWAAWVQAIGSIAAIAGAAWIAIAQTAKQHQNALKVLRLQEEERKRVAFDRAVLCAARVTPPMLDAADAIQKRGDTWDFTSDVVDWLTYAAEEHRLDQARLTIFGIAGDPAFNVAPQDLEAMTPLPEHAAIRLSRANGLLRQLRQRIEATAWYPEHSDEEKAVDVQRWHVELAHIGSLLLPALEVCRRLTQLDQPV